MNFRKQTPRALFNGLFHWIIPQQLYEETECAVVTNGHITRWFEVTVGVRQGCILSPTFFNVFLEFVMDDLKSL